MRRLPAASPRISLVEAERKLSDLNRELRATEAIAGNAREARIRTDAGREQASLVLHNLAERFAERLSL